jgi:hypothetical protein
MIGLEGKDFEGIVLESTVNDWRSAPISNCKNTYKHSARMPRSTSPILDSNLKNVVLQQALDFPWRDRSLPRCASFDSFTAIVSLCAITLLSDVRLISFMYVRLCIRGDARLVAATRLSKFGSSRFLASGLGVYLTL